VLPSDTVDTQASAAVEQASTIGAQTALTTPMNPDGSFESIYGPDATAYLTPDEVALALQDESVGVPAQVSGRETVLLDPVEDLTIPMYEGADGLIRAGEGDTDEPPADVAVYQRVDAEPEVTSAEGPLPQLENYDWSAEDQAGAAAWQAKICQRVAQVVRMVDWRGMSPGDAMQQLSQGIATELIADYADLQRMRNDQDQVERRGTLAGLRTEYGNDLRPVIDALEASLHSLPDQLGEVIIQARARDGRRLINIPGVASWLIQSAVGNGEYVEEEAIDESSEREQILKLAGSDIEAYHRERRWGPNRDQTGAERIYAIDKKRERVA
jgi:hypothetical protein